MGFSVVYIYEMIFSTSINLPIASKSKSKSSHSPQRKNQFNKNVEQSPTAISSPLPPLFHHNPPPPHNSSQTTSQPSPPPDPHHTQTKTPASVSSTTKEFLPTSTALGGRIFEFGLQKVVFAGFCLLLLLLQSSGQT